MAASFFGITFILVVSNPAHIISIQPSVVTAVNKVSMAFDTLSKLSGRVNHSPPRSKHSHLVCTLECKDTGMFFISQVLKSPLKKVVPRTPNIIIVIVEIIAKLINYGTAYIILSTAILIPGYRFTIRKGFSILKRRTTLKELDKFKKTEREERAIKKSIMFQPEKR